MRNLLYRLGLTIHTAYTGIILATFVSTLLMTLLTLAVGALSDDPKVVMVGSIALTVLLVLLVALIYVNKCAVAEIEQVRAGKYWAHWEYDADEWRQFANQEWMRIRTQTRQTLGCVSAVVLVGLLVVCLSAGDMAVMLLVVGFMASLGLSLGVSQYRLDANEYRRRLAITTNADPRYCRAGFIKITDAVALGDGWYAVSFGTALATLIPQLTEIAATRQGRITPPR